MKTIIHSVVLRRMPLKPFFCLLFFALVALANAEVLVHPLGFSFEYPHAWTIRESAFTTLELVPPNPASNDRGPTESYFVIAFGIHASEASDPRLVDGIEALIKQIAPFLVPRGDMELLKQPQHAALMRWRGASPSGVDAGADVYVLPDSSISFALIAIGEQAQIQTREAVIRNLFTSFHTVPVKRNAALAAAWENRVDRTYMHLKPNGSFLATQSGTEEQTSPQTAESEESEAAGGRWFADDENLFLVAEGSTPLMFRYHVGGKSPSRVLVLRDASGQQQTLNESRSK